MARVISQRKFINEALDAHNKYRKLHDAPALELSNELTEQALEWAEHLAERGQLKYKNASLKNEPIGENILRAKIFYLSGDECTNEWYKEENDYKYNGLFTPSTGHFTQLVWKNTRKVGFAYAQTSDGYFYVVANYYPAGNFRNEFEQNVSKPSTLKNLVHSFFPEPRSSPTLNRKIEPRIEYKPEPRALSRILPNDDFEKNSRSAPTGSDSFMDNFIQEALNAHNLCRKKHGSDPLIHNKDISAIAQNYANYLAKIGSLTHSTNTYKGQKLGENLFYHYDSRNIVLSGEKPTMDWYNEIKQYKYRDYQPGTGHFTQVVWKSTKEVGLGLAKANDGSIYVVANYYPAGNFIGQFSDNVKKPYY
ncbi:unnamed protein product [Brachionus calyciflorus]|uniref:SCP domain-containing protein n=1 Tax=Brachionus calyciflorus TaxID=104777 RepID=A0A813RWS5_9BILA|nr:unnamed protein product [Brachionus calyciflorus]